MKLSVKMVTPTQIARKAGNQNLAGEIDFIEVCVKDIVCTEVLMMGGERFSILRFPFHINLFFLGIVDT